MKLLLSPHNDDETLFASFTIMRERPTVCVVFDSFVQPSRGLGWCIADRRRAETEEALVELTRHEYEGTEVPVNFIGLSDAVQHQLSTLGRILYVTFPNAEQVWAPAFEEGGHDQHNLVAQAADIAFPGKVTHYLTYVRGKGKSRNGMEVEPRSGDDIARKLRALACYTSQMNMDPRLGCYSWFMGDLKEYVLPS